MPCDGNAMCEELRGHNNFTCTCIPPYMGDGFMCSRGEYAQNCIVHDSSFISFSMVKYLMTMYLCLLFSDYER